LPFIRAPDHSPCLQARARLGTTLRGKYKLEEVLGVGGSAVVYRAQHRNRAAFALKMLLPELAEDEEIRTRFLREGYVANSVKHPGVVQIVDDDVSEDGAAFLVMELLVGLSADELLRRRGQLPPDIALMIGHQLLDVLASAHAAGIVHRDIKPANVFVTKEGQVKVLDFGIARLRDATFAGASLTQSGVSFGTPAFMSPEQALGKTRKVDERSDIYGVGAALFVLMTGKLVHDAETTPMIMVKTATEPAASVATLLPNLAPDLASVVDGALKFKKKDRWQSATQMRDALYGVYVAAFGEAPNVQRLAAYVNDTPHRSAERIVEGTPAPLSSVSARSPRRATVIAAQLCEAPRGFGAQSRLHCSRRSGSWGRAHCSGALHARVRRQADPLRRSQVARRTSPRMPMAKSTGSRSVSSNDLRLLALPVTQAAGGVIGR